MSDLAIETRRESVTRPIFSCNSDRRLGVPIHRPKRAISGCRSCPYCKSKSPHPRHNDVIWRGVSARYDFNFRRGFALAKMKKCMTAPRASSVRPSVRQSREAAAILGTTHFHRWSSPPPLTSSANSLKGRDFMATLCVNRLTPLDLGGIFYIG